MSEAVRVSAEVLVGLGKKSKSEVVAMLSSVQQSTLDELLKQLPVQWLLRAQALASAEKKEKMEQSKKSKEKKKQPSKESKKRKEREKFDFASFYARIKQSMLRAHSDEGTVQHALFGEEGGESLMEALHPQQPPDVVAEDADLYRVQLFVSQALIAEKGLNSLSFMQACMIGKRFAEVFGYHQQEKDSARFVRKQWGSYIDYLKAVAPEMDPRQERNYRRTHELAQLFPCVKLISGCSIHEFWMHMREFRDFLASNDHEAMQWRCAGDSSRMQFQKAVHYEVFGAREGLESMGLDDMDVPFAMMNVRGDRQEEDAFLEQKDDFLDAWAEEEEEEEDNKHARHSPEEEDDDEMDEDE